MMPYDVEPFRLVMSPNMVMLDTNVLVSAFVDTNDGRHETARDYIELLGNYGIALVPVPVLVETWGLLVGSRKAREAGLTVLDWALDPARVQLVPGHHNHAGQVSVIARKFDVDIVDAWILFLTSDMYTKCELNERVRIATFDARDFVRCAGRFPIRLYDLHTNEDLDY